MIILRVFLKVRGQFVDLARGHRNLHLGRASVFVVHFVLAHDAGFYSFSKHYLLWYIIRGKLARMASRFATHRRIIET